MSNKANTFFEGKALKSHEQKQTELVSQIAFPQIFEKCHENNCDAVPLKNVTA